PRNAGHQEGKGGKDYQHTQVMADNAQIIKGKSLPHYAAHPLRRAAALAAVLPAIEGSFTRSSHQEANDNNADSQKEDET
ncbi:MAG: hypothetical protein RSD38_04805, partial [Raoultibacter sp.]